MTLDQVALETPARVVGFAGLEPADQARLAGLGLRRGASVVKLLATPLKDPIECLVGPQLLALDRWLLERIVVEPAAQAAPRGAQVSAGSRAP